MPVKHINVELCKIHLVCLGRSELNSNLESPLCLRGNYFPSIIRPFYPFFFFQSLALQDGCQKKIKLEKIARMLESAADSHVVAGSEPGAAMVDKACRREPNTYDRGLLCAKEIHVSGSSAIANRSARSCVEKQCSFLAESDCSTTGSLNYFFFLRVGYFVD